MSATPATPCSSSTRSVLQDLPFCLAKTALTFRRFCDETLRALGPTPLAPGAASVLHAIDELAPCPVSRLVETTLLPNATLTGLLDSLEGGGYILRIRNPDDGRSRLIQLTDNGRRLCAQLHVRHREVMTVYSAALSDSEMVELKRLLEKATVCMSDYTGNSLESTNASN